MYNIPCSHVAHLEKEGLRDYRKGEEHIIQVRTNIKRVVEVWFDEYKETFYYYNQHLKVLLLLLQSASNYTTFSTTMNL